jgi:DNA adenine methylase
MNNHYTHKGRFLRPPLKIIGGKQKTRDIIYSYFPDLKEKVLVDLFMGSGAISIGAPESYIIEANDINSDLINFYRCLKHESDELFNRIQIAIEKLHIGQKEEFLKVRDNIPVNFIDQAVRTYIINKSCMNGVLRLNSQGKCNSSWCGTSKGRGWLTRSWLEALKIKLNNINFTNFDFRLCLEILKETYNRDHFVFIDPPYQLMSSVNPNGSKTIYNGVKFTSQDHEDLALIIKTAKFQWLLTINDCVWTRERYKGFIIEEMPVFYSCSQTSEGRGKKTELLIRNYEK